MSKILKVSSIVWILMCITIATYGITQSHGGNPQGGIAPGIYLMILTAPLGLIVPFLVVYIVHIFAEPGNLGLIGSLIIYSGMIVVGYYQWFILLPKLIAKFKNRNASK